MGFGIFAFLALVLFFFLAYHRSSLLFAVTAFFIFLLGGLWAARLPASATLIIITSYLLLAVIFTVPVVRRNLFTRYLFRKVQSVVPKVSTTEQQALDAGTLWWDREIWNGNPDWNQLLEYPVRELTGEEQAFLDGPVETLCTMLDDWKITHEELDLPPQVWDFLKQKHFFGIIIPKQYGGLGFSATAHSEIIVKIASRSIPAAVTVMVPNSLGPAELLMHYGTREQQDYYLPRLSNGEEIPCFGLTGPEAGSDASSIPDTGIVCREEYKGKQTIGIRLNWHKRYITLGPIATLIGLAFKLYDPDKILGQETDLGITFALVPRDTPHITIGSRHFPLNCPFQNGPNQGTNVFIPLDMVIGGPEGLGKGWSMLMEALAAGRGISLPALSTGGGKLAARAMGAYAMARRQFNLPIAKFEGIEEALTRIAGNTYTMDSVRLLTVYGIDNGERPAVITAIAKYHLTELMRAIANDAMDIHGGAGICLGPRNILGRMYQAAPIGITVEGANILTRSFIIFNQSLLRCHPWLKEEITGVAEQNLIRFDNALFHHIGFLLSNYSRALVYGLTGIACIQPAEYLSETRDYQRQVTQMATRFALLGDIALLVLGGGLKRQEKLTARLSDTLGYLVLTMSVIKHFADQKAPEEDRPLLDWACQKNLYLAQESIWSFLQNFPARNLARVLQLTIFPVGRRLKYPDDRLGKKVAGLITTPSGARDRLTRGVFVSQYTEKLHPRETLSLLDRFLILNLQTHHAQDTLHKAFKQGMLTHHDRYDRIEEAIQKKMISVEDADKLRELEQLHQQIITVDDFANL
ncbi:acyl-CoA dehydrogenase [Desulfogranum japonicum]|uniref:acyl-CoA dehydrogenase n=1 Tax=Desulfogranum japonicum TaxID=231447 RepID=UPI00042736AB|nr:acyl-CoA dehydrogenase [Desulfogranum japonicum]